MQSKVGLSLCELVSFANARQRFCLPGHLQNDVGIFFLEQTICRGEMVANTRLDHCNVN